jgi:magnesium chelatase family protein
MDARLLRRHVRLPDDVERPLLDSYRRGDLSARGRDRTLRLARTIADLAASHEVRREHVVAALGYRQEGGAGVGVAA